MTDYPDLDDASYESALIRLREQFAREQDGNIKARALKVNDPEFLLGRLADDKQALLVTRVTRKSLEGTPFLLVNKKKGDDDPVQAFAVVQFEQEEGTIESLEALGRRVAAIDEESRVDFGEGGEKAGSELFVLKLSLLDKFPKPVTLKSPPPGRRFGGDVDLNRDRLREAFHIRGTHWEPVPEDGTCPVSHPNKMDAPDGGSRCYTDSAAAALKGSRDRQSESGVEFGAFLKGLADKAGLTFAEIARASGMSPSTVSAVLNGEVNRPDDKCVKGFATYFKIPEERLFRMLESDDTIFVTESAEDDEALHEGIRPMFGSPGGKRFLASTIIGFIPEHTKYVEPFVGGGAIFFGKRSSDKEVINDMHQGVSQAYRFVQSVTEAQIAELGKAPTEFSRDRFFRLRDSKPSGDVSTFHRFMYLNAFSFGGSGRDPRQGKDDGCRITLTHKINRLGKIRERLKGVAVSGVDFRKVIQEHDGPSTFFYLDPPYHDQQAHLKTSLTNADIRAAVDDLKGKWILSLPDTKSVRETFAKYDIKTVSVRRTMDMKTSHKDSELLISNFPLRTSGAYRFREQASERTGQQIAPSGLHEHPHPPNGIHTHLGSPPNSGGHAHERSPGSGAHRHRDGDPIDGFHLGDPTDEGAHVHILANREKVPALWEWYRKVVAAHFPKHQWLEGHKATWVAELQEDGTFGEARQTEQGDWDMHGLWAMHSAGANAKQHEAAHLDPETRIVQVFYEFENDERRESTAEDFEKEVAWFDENLPFPREEVTKALGEDGEFQEAGVRFIGNCAGAEVAFTMREVSLDSARDLARDLCEANPEMAISICSGDFSLTVGPRRQAERNGAVQLRGSLVGDLFTNSRGLVANLRTTDLREATPVEDDQWAVAIEGGNRHARFLHLPSLPSDDLKVLVGEMALSNPDRVFHLAKATERDKSAGLVFRKQPQAAEISS